MISTRRGYTQRERLKFQPFPLCKFEMAVTGIFNVYSI
ncbi:hypothetical protein SAMN04488128_102572 [Chitinophaga eiseniae]|uniref:Uncharacterized protein n=1 Tax=Chitinophaga eiseniae TaxID=634771 RepID=A0A1T4QSG4_9BACT|nr:hypothetical protein SAMN04488128_102572 [Chitinophaga eiseniae]